MQKKRKIRFIINPISGANKYKDQEKIIEHNLDLNQYDYECVFTQYAGHATELSIDAVSQTFDVVVAYGGDGTVNEVAKGLVGSDTTLGILPGGSGNGFAMYIGMGRNTAKAIKILNNAESKMIDTCLVNDHFFINLAGIGFDALIAHKARTQKKRGFKMYANLVSKELLKFKAPKSVVYLDDRIIEGAYTTIAIANARMYGYNFTVAPQADLTDGLFDIVFLKEAGLLRTIASSWRMLNGSLNKSTLVEVHKAKSVKVESDSLNYFHVDGESFSFSETLQFTINPKSLKVLIPVC